MAPTCANGACLGGETPMWRRGWTPKGTEKAATLCNACGILYKRNWFCEWCQTVYRKRREDESLRTETQRLPDDLFWVGCESCDRWCHLACEVAHDVGGLACGEVVPAVPSARGNSQNELVPATQPTADAAFTTTIPTRRRFHCNKCREGTHETSHLTARDAKWAATPTSFSAGAEVRAGVLAHFRPFLRDTRDTGMAVVGGLGLPKPGSVANNDACREPPVSAAPCERGRGKRKREPFAAPGKRDEQARAEPARKKRVPPKSKSPSGRKPSTSKSPSGRKSSTSKSHSSKDASVPFLNETNHATEPFFCADEITAVETVAELMSPPRRPRSTRVTATALRAGTTPAARVDSVDPVDPVAPVTQPEANPRADAFPCAKSPVDRLMETETSRQHVSPAKTKAATRAPAPFAKGSPRELNGNLGPPVGLRLLRQAPGGSSTPPAPPGSPQPTHEVGASRNRDARGDGSVLANLLLSSRGVGKQAGESQTKESRTTKPTIQCIAPPSTRVSGAMKFVTFAPTPPQKKQHTEPGTAETPLGSDFRLERNAGPGPGARQVVVARPAEHSPVLLEDKDADPWGLGVTP